jgi:hypothetical protein
LNGEVYFPRGRGLAAAQQGVQWRLAARTSRPLLVTPSAPETHSSSTYEFKGGFLTTEPADPVSAGSSLCTPRAAAWLLQRQNAQQRLEKPCAGSKWLTEFFLLSYHVEGTYAVPLSWRKRNSRTACRTALGAPPEQWRLGGSDVFSTGCVVEAAALQVSRVSRACAGDWALQSAAPLRCASDNAMWARSALAPRSLALRYGRYSHALKLVVPPALPAPACAQAVAARRRQAPRLRAPRRRFACGRGARVSAA